MNRQPLLIVLLFFVAGILTEENVNFPLWAVFSGLFSFVIVLAFAFSKSILFQKLKNFALCCLFFFLGIFLHFQQNNFSLPSVENGKTEIKFILKKKLNSNENFKKYEVEILKTTTGKIGSTYQAILSIPQSFPELDFANYYSAMVYLKKVEPPKQDFLFDYAKYLKRKNIFYQAWFQSDLSKSEKEMTFSEKIKQGRLKILENISHSNLSVKTVAFTKGIILADRTEMDAGLVSDFSRTGLVHFLAISGTHMVIIFWLIMFLLRKILPNSKKNWAIILSLLFIWIFTVFIDYGSSVVRSSVMITVYYIYHLLHRKADLLHAMALAGFILLLVDTNAIFDVGFQLSFLAVLGIFWLNPALVRVLPKPKNNLQKFLISIITVSISAQLATLPLVLFYFHQYSILSVFANLIIVPFSEIIIVFSLLMTIVLGIGIELTWLNAIYELVVTFLLKTIHFFSEINWAFQENIPMSILEAGLLLVIIYFLRDILTKKSTKVILRFSFVFILFVGVRMLLNYYFQNTMEVIEIQNNKQKIILYKDQKKLWVFAKSTINEPKTIQFVIQPYLSNRRISEYSIKYIPDNYSQVMVNGKAYSLE